MVAVEDQLWDGFARAVVRIGFAEGTRVLRPRNEPGAVDEFPFADAVHIVSACNPSGASADDASNAAASAALAELAAKLGVLTLSTIGSGSDGSIPEPGVLFEGISREDAVALGVRFGQSAVYEWRRDALEIIGALDPGSLLLGWRLTDLDGLEAVGDS